MRHLEWLRVLAVLALLGPFVYLSTRLYGRTLAGRYQGRHLKVLESVTFGQNQRLVLLKASNRVLLVSFGDHATALLREFDQDEFPAAVAAQPMVAQPMETGPGLKTKPVASSVGAGEGARSWTGLVQSLEVGLKELRTLRALWGK